ncbi:MAG: hypothetical protein Q9162_007257 [Coniocarpon cinnabarinum]
MADAAPKSSIDEAFAKLKPPEDVIQPPRDLKNIIERTASYIYRNGKAFEERLRTKQSDDPKFSWLKSDDIFRKYYEWRLEEIKQNRGIDMGQNQESAATAVGQQQRGAKKPELEKPPEYQFSAKMPNISAQDLDVVKLTALFVARNGRQLITQISQKEAGNYQFEFLRPQHTLNGFFQRLIEQYELLIKPEAEFARKTEQRKAELEKTIQDKYHILERTKHRAKYIQTMESRRAAKVEKEEQERIAYAEIDWHDFAVVETIVFTGDDDKEDLPPPMSLNDLQASSLEEKGRMTENLVSSSRRIEEAMPGEFDFPNGAQTAFQVPPHQQPPPAQVPSPFPPNGAPIPQRPPSQQPPVFPTAPPPPASASPPQGQPFQPPPPLANNRLASPANPQQPTQPPPRPPGAAPNIRTDYQPRARARAKEQTAQCPMCHQHIPLSEYNQHLQIEQLDPRWRDQRNKEAQRNAVSNLSTADVANNLKRLASQRNDNADGSKGDEITEEEKERRRKAARGYDGVIPGLVRPGPTGKSDHVDLQEQLSRIREKAGRG